MRIEVHDNISELPLPRAAWNAIAERGTTRTVFQTYEWASAWWETFGHRYRLMHLAFESAEPPTSGFACLMASATDRRSGQWHIVADANSDYCDIPVDGNRFAALDALVKFFARDFVEWESLAIMNIPEESMTLAALATLCERYGLGFRTSKRIAAPKLRIDSDGPDVRLKYSVRRHCTRLQRLGDVEFRLLRERNDLPRLLAVLYEQHVNRYRQRGERSLFEESLYRRFYERLALAMLDAGWLNFSELTLDGSPIAVHLGFEYDKVLTWYKPAFDIACQRYSPGTVLIKHLIDYAQDRQLDVLDFTVGDEAFKERFSNATSYNRNAFIYRSRPAACIHAVRDQSIAAAKRIVTALGHLHVPSQRRHTHP